MLILVRNCWESSVKTVSNEVLLKFYLTLDFVIFSGMLDVIRE